MKRIILLFFTFHSFTLYSSPLGEIGRGLQSDLRNYKMAGPYEVVARDGEFRASKGGSERDMWTAFECAKQGYTDKALEIINAYATTLQRFDGHDAPLCCIQGYWVVRAMTILRSHATAEWGSMIRRAMLPTIDKFEADSPYANGNWGAIVNRCRMACAIFLEDSVLYKASIDYFLHANDNGSLPKYVSETGQCQETGRDQAHVQLGLGALCETCEMAWQQGDDLWGALDNRLMKGLEYTAKYNLGYDMPFETWQDCTGLYCDWTTPGAMQRGRITGDWSKFEGIIKHTTKDKCLPLDMSSGMPNGTLNLAEGCAVSNTAKAFAIGKLTGKGQLLQPVANWVNNNGISGNNTWNVGNSWETGGDFTFDGIFSDGGSGNRCIFNKVGTCKMTVSGKSTHSGATTVKAGELCIKSGAQLGTGTLTVQNGATLSGVTTAAAPLTNSTVTIAAGATLRVGSTATATTGLMDFGGKNVTLNSGSTMHLGASRPATAFSTGCTSLQNIGTLTINAAIELYVPESHTLTVGDSIVIWKDVTNVKGTPMLTSSVINAEQGLYWDTTDLTQGILRVTDQAPVGIRSILDASDASDAVYE